MRRRLAVPSDAEDVLQQALIAALRGTPALRDEAALVPWFYQVLRNAVVDHLRAQARGARRLDGFEEVAALPPHEVGSCACSLVLLRELPPSYAEILERVDVRDEPIEDVAASLGVTVGNATVRLHRARRGLRERLLACCGCTSTDACQSCSCARGEV
ncbi:MAG: sigma-70 family RNA polymerase sigma factor [Polyangiaceae bacterium]